MVPSASAFASTASVHAAPVALHLVFVSRVQYPCHCTSLDRAATAG